MDGAALESFERPSPLRAYDDAVRAMNATGPSAPSAVDCGPSVPMPGLPLVEDCYED